MAGPHAPVSLARTNPDGEGAAAAERGDSTIRDHNGEIIHILHSATKSPPPGQNAGCVIYDRHKQNKMHLVKQPVTIHIPLVDKMGMCHLFIYLVIYFSL